ncbi:hypothetical protein ACKI1O_52540, partial [Streptomyces scabiei]
AILTSKKLESQQDNFNNVVTMLHKKFQGLIELLDKNRVANEAVFKRLQEELEERIPSMGLDDDQEMFIYQKVDQTIQNSVAR